MIHSLEHFVEPLKTLQKVSEITEQHGYLFVEVCNLEENPFDLLVADHLTHFSPKTLEYAVSRVGFEVELMQTAWIKKEISMLAKHSDSELTPLRPNDGEAVMERTILAVRWLSGLIASANRAAQESKEFGIFGTSIAGTWLGAALVGKVAFFVDEDPNRIGKQFMGKPIISPKSIPSGTTVYLALAPVLAEDIGKRLTYSNPRVKFIQPT
jgi:hypothetical protein